jgi:Fic family protein
MFYISAFFEAHRDEYYDHLLSISRDNNWTDWCQFFLRAVQSKAEENQKKATAILHLYETMKPKIAELTRSQYAIPALDWIFERPIFKISDFVAHVRIPDPTAKRMLAVLRDEGLLKTLVEGRGRRSTILAFRALLNISEGYDAF